MLEELDKVEWHNLTHAYGKASDLPALIKNLASGTDEQCRETLYNLYCNIYHQGTIYEATAYAIPFLLELLPDSTIQYKGEILLLLAHLAQGSSYVDVHQSLTFLHSEAERCSPIFKDQLIKELSWVEQTRVAVSAGLGIYLELLLHSDAYVRGCACYVLASCMESSSQILPAVLARLDVEPDALVKSCLLLCIGDLCRHDSPYLNRLFTLLHAAELPLVRIVAAMDLVLYAKDAAPVEAMQVLMDAIQHPCAEIVSCYSDLPWARTNLASDIYDLFCILSPSVAAQALDTLLHEMEHADSSVVAELDQRFEQLKVLDLTGGQQSQASVLKMAAAMKIMGIREVQSALRVLLHIAFSGKAIERGSTVGALTPTQYLVLDAIVHNDAAWIVDGSTENILRSFGLLQWRTPPSTRGREKLRLFLRNAMPE